MPINDLSQSYIDNRGYKPEPWQQANRDFVTQNGVRIALGAATGCVKDVRTLYTYHPKATPAEAGVACARGAAYGAGAAIACNILRVDKIIYDNPKLKDLDKVYAEGGAAAVRAVVDSIPFSADLGEEDGALHAAGLISEDSVELA